MSSTFERLQSLLSSHLEIGAGVITPDMRLCHLGVDSLRSLEIIFTVEEAFDTRLDERQYDTVQDIVDAIDRPEEA
jgi:acyl carrier protein